MIENTPESVKTHLCFFCCFCVSSFFGTSFFFFGGVLCSLREVLPFLFLLPSRVLSTVLRSCSPSSSRRRLLSTCFLRGEPALGLPMACSFWPGRAPRLPAAPSALGACFLEGLLSDLSPAGGKMDNSGLTGLNPRKAPLAVRNQMFKTFPRTCWLQGPPLLESLVSDKN